MAVRTTRATGDEPGGDAASAGGEQNRRILIRGGALAAVICALAVAVVCIAGRFPGDSMDIAWVAPAREAADESDVDRDAHAGDADWLAGDTWVQSRSGAATGYDAGTGRQVWTYRPPGGSTICAAQADLEQAVMVVTRDDEKRPASDKGQLCTTLAAVDMENGRELWRTPVPAPPREGVPGRFDPQPVTAGGGLAVLAHQGLRAVDVRTGTPRWTAAVPRGCIPAHALPAVRHVGALLACGGTDKGRDGIPQDAELQAAAFDPATGALLWSTPIGDREPATWGEGGAALVSADPLVVDDVSAFFSFSGDGRPNPPIGSRGLDRASAAVDGTRLYTLSGRFVKGVGTRHHALAFDLATGQRVWKTDLDSRVRAFHLQDGRLTVVGDGHELLLFPAVHLYLLDAATGRERDVRSFPFGEDPAGDAFEHEGLLIIGGTAYERS